MWKTAFLFGIPGIQHQACYWFSMDQILLSEGRTHAMKCSCHSSKGGRLLNIGNVSTRRVMFRKKAYGGHQSLIFWSDSLMELLKEVFGRANPKSILGLTMVPLQQILYTMSYVLEKRSQLLNPKGSWCSQNQGMIRKGTYCFLDKTTGLNPQKVDNSHNKKCYHQAWNCLFWKWMWQFLCAKKCDYLVQLKT